MRMVTGMWVGVLLGGTSLSAQAQSAVVFGELKKWHRVTLTFAGPDTSESATPNPFRDYRLNVTFTHGDKSAVVPGYYAADGRAGDTGAKSGNRWRVHFAPDEVGTWKYAASFRTGPDVVLADAADAGRPTAFDGLSGEFVVAASDKSGRDHRAKGLLRYVGKHYLQFAETGEYYLKGGADSPENFLAYYEFDDTFDTDPRFNEGNNDRGKFVHRYEPHSRDWKSGDPTWGDGKGKNIIGAINYLASKGMNSVYFMVYNIDGGDGKDTWPWTAPDVRDRFDCSKLDQWEVVFTHMDRLGIQLHFVLSETENDENLGGTFALNPMRKLYHRELCARFSHHLALIWNLGEENDTPDPDRKDIARYIRDHDAYKHPITVHTHNNKAPDCYNGLLGDPFFEATSIQGRMENYNRDAIVLRHRSRGAGRPWAIFGDEQPSAQVGVLPDADDPDHDIPRIHAMWGNLLGGGSGCEWYFGYRHAHMDLNCEDWRSRDRMWDQTRYALEFFEKHLPFTEMEPDNDLVYGVEDGRVFVKPGEIYAVHLPSGGSAKLDLQRFTGTFDVKWYNPRTGGELKRGAVKSIAGPGMHSIGAPPSDPDRDWVALVGKTGN